MTNTKNSVPWFIYRYLNEHGYRTRAGNDLSRSLWILSFAAYSTAAITSTTAFKEGDRQRPKDKSEWITVKDHHPAIVSRGQKERILALLESNRRLKSFRKSGKSKYTHIFSGLLICGNCGQPMTSSISTVKKTTGRRYSLYFCPTHRKSKLWVYWKIYLRPNHWRVRLQLHSQYAQRSKGVLSGNEHTGTGTTATLWRYLLPGGRHCPGRITGSVSYARTGTVKGEVFGKDVKIKTDSEPPLQLSKLKRKKSVWRELLTV